jgi:flagellar hook-associated protein 3 FlgL
MRITQSGTYRTIMNEMDRLTEGLNSLQVQAATGKRVSTASDDPTAVQPMLFTRSQLTETDQYISNVEDGLDRMDVMDGYLDTMQNYLTRVKEIGVAGSNATLSANDRLSYADELSQIREAVTDQLNAQFNGRHLFSGYKEGTPPLTATQGASVESPDGTAVADMTTYAVTDGITRDEIELQTGPGQSIPVNLNAEELIMTRVPVRDADGAIQTDADGNPVMEDINLLDTLATMEAALRADDAEGVGGMLDELDAGAEQIRLKRSSMGNSANRLETALESLEQSKLDLKETLSGYEDADLVETLALMTQQESALQAALTVTGRVSKLSILDYM